MNMWKMSVRQSATTPAHRRRTKRLSHMRGEYTTHPAWPRRFFLLHSSPMQLRTPLAALLVLGLTLAGCAQKPGTSAGMAGTSSSAGQALMTKAEAEQKATQGDVNAM